MLRSIIYLLAWPELFSMSRAIGSSLRKVCWYASGVPSKLFAHAASALLLLAAETSLLKQLQDVTVFRLKLSPQNQIVMAFCVHSFSPLPPAVT